MRRHLGIAAAAAASSALVAFAPAAHAAFVIVQATGGDYVPVSPLEACGAGFCRTWLKPVRVQNLGQMSAANTMRLSDDVDAQKPGYTITDLAAPLDLTFTVDLHKAINDGTIGGGQLRGDLTGVNGAAPPSGLHWIQVVTDNYNISGNDGTNTNAAKGIGQPENTIDATDVASPYYDDEATHLGFNATPPHFEDFSSRDEPTAANPLITWTANLYLVSDGGEGDITVYDGIRWGWYTRYFGANSVGPEPGVWMTLVLGFGFIGRALRRRKAVMDLTLVN